MHNIKSGKTFVNSNNTVLLTISKDNFAAYLTFRENPGLIDENEILKLLQEAEVSHGYTSAIKYNEQHKIKKEIGIPFLIALGSNPHSKPEIVLLFDRKKCFNPDESFSVFEMAQYVTIESGQPLAEVSVAMSSQSGKNIFGHDVNAFSKDEPSIYNYIGENIKFDDENNLLIALKSGYPYIDSSNRIQIKSDFYINEDLEDVELELFGDLVVNGVVFSSNLDIHGDLMIYGDIEDCLDYGVFATGNITLDYATNSRLVSGGQIKFHNEVENCLLSAKEGIWGEENSSVLGGLLQSSNYISLYNVGDEKPVITEIEIILSSFTKELLKKNEYLIQKQIDHTSKKQKLDQNIVDDLSQKIKELEEQYLKEVETALSSPPKRFKISIIKQVYPETLFRILNHSNTVKEEKGKIIFTLIDNEMVINEVDRFV